MEYAIRMITTHYDRIRLVDDWETAVAMAREFVGPHNPVDGCSSKPREYHTKQLFRISRPTPFGQRCASVIPVVNGMITL